MAESVSESLRKVLGETGGRFRDAGGALNPTFACVRRDEPSPWIDTRREARADDTADAPSERIGGVERCAGPGPLTMPPTLTIDRARGVGRDKGKAGPMGPEGGLDLRKLSRDEFRAIAK